MGPNLVLWALQLLSNNPLNLSKLFLSLLLLMRWPFISLQGELSSWQLCLALGLFLCFTETGCLDAQGLPSLLGCVFFLPSFYLLTTTFCFSSSFSSTSREKHPHCLDVIRLFELISQLSLLLEWLTLSLSSLKVPVRLNLCLVLPFLHTVCFLR